MLNFIVFLDIFYELTNEATVNTTALQLGIPIPHALALKSQGGQYGNIDIWGHFLLNSSAYAGDTRKIQQNGKRIDKNSK